MILIKNGRVVCPITGTDEVKDVLIDEGKIIQVEKDIETGEGTWLENKDVAVIDAAGLVVAPGLVDSHVHFRDPGFEYKRILKQVLQLQPEVDLQQLYVWLTQSRL